MQLKLNALLVIISIVTLSACSKDEALEPLPQDARILAFGDSLTEGKGVSSSNSYPAVLSQLSGIAVINEGISGELSEQGARRLPLLLETHQPNLLLLMHGGNDILQNVKPEIAKANISSMVTDAQNLNIPVVLIGIPEKNLFSKTAAIYREVADEHGLVLEDSIISSLLKKPSMKSDSVHFNKAGYKAIAERMLSVLDENGAL